MGESVWTIPGTVDRLKQLHELKLSCTRIGDKLTSEFNSRFTRNSVIGKIHRLGLPPNRPNFQEGGARQPRVRKPARGGTNVVRRAPKFNPQPFLARDIEAAPRHVSLADLEAGECRFPYGDGPFTFCGCEAIPGKPYCLPHHALTWTRDRTPLPSSQAAPPKILKSILGTFA